MLEMKAYTAGAVSNGIHGKVEQCMSGLSGVARIFVII